MSRLRIDDEFVGAVEDRVTYGHGAWDMEDPAKLCEAVIAEYLERTRPARKRSRLRPTPKKAVTSWRSGRVRLNAAGIQALRLAVWERCNWRCENGCGREVTWISGELHHLKHRSRGGSDTLENCQFWCKPCHRKHHNGR